MTLTHGSLFTGAGIFDLAAENNGITNIFGCDNDPFCQLHYKEHYPDSVLFQDIKKLETIPYVDILTMGFPCQDVSRAGAKIDNPLFDGKRTSLFWESIRLIQQSQPGIIIAENVARLRNNGLYECLQAFATCGYNAGYCILSAAKFGAVHQRERIFIIAYPMRFGRAAIVQILKSILNNNFQRETRKVVWDEFDRSMCIEMESQAKEDAIRDNYGSSEWVLEGLYAKMAGNTIYYPVAKVLMKNVKDELLKNIDQWRNTTKQKPSFN